MIYPPDISHLAQQVNVTLRVLHTCITYVISAEPSMYPPENLLYEDLRIRATVIHVLCIQKHKGEYEFEIKPRTRVGKVT